MRPIASATGLGRDSSARSSIFSTARLTACSGLNVSFFSDVFSLHFWVASETVSAGFDFGAAGFGFAAAGFTGAAALGGAGFSGSGRTAAFA